MPLLELSYGLSQSSIRHASVEYIPAVWGPYCADGKREDVGAGRGLEGDFVSFKKCFAILFLFSPISFPRVYKEYYLYISVVFFCNV